MIKSNALDHDMTVLTSVCVIVHVYAYTQADWAGSGATHKYSPLCNIIA